MAALTKESIKAAIFPIFVFSIIYVLYIIWAILIIPNLFKYFIINIDLNGVSRTVFHYLVYFPLIAWAGFRAAKEGEGLVGGAVAGLITGFTISLIFIMVINLLIAPYTHIYSAIFDPLYLFIAFNPILSFIIGPIFGAIGAFIGKNKK